MMRWKSKKVILLTGGITATLLLAQCDTVTVLTSEMLFRPKIVELPMGEGKIVSYEVNSWVKKPYLMILGFESEYQNYGEAFFNGKLETVPYKFSIKCYKIEKDSEILFYEKNYTMKDLSGMDGWNSQNPDKPYAWGGSYSLGGFDLSYGRYRCDLKDESSIEIKTYLKEAGIARTAFQIIPYKLWFY